MSNQSMIEHKANMYYVEFREDYLTICKNSDYSSYKKKSKASPYCMSLILAILEHWTNNKRGKNETLDVFMSYAQWNDEMFGMFGRTVIIDSIDALINIGFVSKSPYKMIKGQNTFQYILHYKIVNEKIRSLPERDPNLTHPLVNGCDNDPSTSKRVPVQKYTGTHPLVNGYPSKSGRNVECSIDSTQLLADVREPEVESDLALTDIQPPTSSKKVMTPLVGTYPTKLHPQVTLTPEQCNLLDLFCQIETRPRITEDLQGQCQTLAPHVKTPEDMESLYQFVATRLGPEKSKKIYLKNLCNDLQPWLRDKEKKVKALAVSKTAVAAFDIGQSLRRAQGLLPATRAIK